MSSDDRPLPPGPPYKNSMGNYLTESLFVEISYNNNAPHRPIFCLIEKPGLIHLRSSFVELMDPTGYDWAIKYLGSYQHYERLLKTSWFAKEIDEAINEIKVILKNKAIKKIKEISESQTNMALPASKYIATHDWERTSGRGRPTKSEIKGELKKAIKDVEVVSEDAKRIGLSLIEGGKR